MLINISQKYFYCLEGNQAQTTINQSQPTPPAALRRPTTALRRVNGRTPRYRVACTTLTEKNPAGTVVRTLNYRYDIYGRVIEDQRLLAGKTYTTRSTYGSVANSTGQPGAIGQLTQLSYPSGRLVNYRYDVLGRINQITTQASSTAAVQTLASNIQYQGMGNSSKAIGDRPRLFQTITYELNALGQRIRIIGDRPRLTKANGGVKSEVHQKLLNVDLLGDQRVKLSAAE